MLSPVNQQQQQQYNHRRLKQGPSIPGAHQWPPAVLVVVFLRHSLSQQQPVITHSIPKQQLLQPMHLLIHGELRPQVMREKGEGGEGRGRGRRERERERERERMREWEWEWETDRWCSYVPVLHHMWNPGMWLARNSSGSKTVNLSSWQLGLTILDHTCGHLHVQCMAGLTTFYLLVGVYGMHCLCVFTPPPITCIYVYTCTCKSIGQWLSYISW